IALITGIYERLVHAIGKLRFSFIKPLLKLDFSEFIRLCKEEIDYELFIPLLLGIAIAMLTLSKVIGFLLDYYPEFTFAFFLGLILASSYVLYTRVVHFSPKIIIISVIGFLLSFIFVGLNPIAANHSLPILFFFRYDSYMCYDTSRYFRSFYSFTFRSISLYVKCFKYI
ncbi:DUF368 domain-containing protein, partial [Methanobrevibacter arboriphilus]|uniref:DUF368 domain-containing protein n=1 Tax=Methanobrevibacter arboriphilus TaxID=39441 RepID=UPI0021E649F7